MALFFDKYYCFYRCSSAGNEVVLLVMKFGKWLLPPTIVACWRKCARFQDFIVARRLLYASNSGTFGGGGVYVADAYAEEQRGVNCATMSPLDIATRFQIPNPIEPRPSDITGFVDIVELRKGYLKVKQVGPNTAGQIEYLIAKPIVVVPEFRDIPPTSSVTALVLTPGIVEIDNVCVIRGE